MYYNNAVFLRLNYVCTLLRYHRLLGIDVVGDHKPCLGAGRITVAASNWAHLGCIHYSSLILIILRCLVAKSKRSSLGKRGFDKVVPSYLLGSAVLPFLQSLVGDRGECMGDRGECMELNNVFQVSIKSRVSASSIDAFVGA
jgi:hypothetical protein